MRYHLVLFLIVLVFRPFYGQGEAASSERIEPRRFDQKVWKEVVGTTDYSQERPSVRKKKATGNSASSTTSGKRFEQPEDDESENAETFSLPLPGGLLNVIAYALIIGAIGYILFLIIKNTSFQTNQKINKSDTADHSTPVENIQELEIDRLLREAIAAGNYRLAIRICFLGMLKKLDDDGFIAWKKDKTNRDYLAELLSKESYFDEIRALTLAYEQVWYGEHSLPVERYEEIIFSFKAIDQKLNAPKST